MLIQPGSDQWALIPLLFARYPGSIFIGTVMVRQLLCPSVFQFPDDFRITARREKIHQVSIRIAEQH